MSNSNSNTNNANSNSANNYLQQALSFQMMAGKSNSFMQFVFLTFQNQLQTLGDVIVEKLKKEIATFKWFDGFSIINCYLFRLYKIYCKIWYPIRNILPFINTKSNRIKSSDDMSDIDLKTLKIAEAQSYIETSIIFQKSFWTYISSEQHRDNFRYNIKKVVSVRQIDNLTVETSQIYNNITLDIPSHELQLEFKQELEVKLNNKYNKSEIQSVNGSDLDILSFDKFQPINEDDIHVHQLLLDKHGYQLNIYYPVERYITNSKVIDSLKYLVNKLDEAEIGPKIWENLIGPKSLINFEFFQNSARDTYFEFDTKKDPNEQKQARLNFFNQREIHQENEQKQERKYFCIIFSVLISIIFNEDITPKDEIKALKPHGHFKDYMASHSFFTLGFLNTNLCDSGDDIDLDYYIYIMSNHPKIKKTFKLMLSIVDKLRGLSIFNNPENWKSFINHILYICGLEPLYTIETSQAKASDNSMGVIIKAQLNIDKQVILQKFYQFLDSLNKTKSTAKKVQTFDIKMLYEEKVTKTLNPEYELYQKKLEEINKQPISEATTKAKNDCINNMPVQFLEEKKWVKEVKCDRINEVSKDLSKLYLSKADKQKLETMLQDFRDDKEMLEELGLPNKLCVLLYGEPGCGKSSTIETIGSYLQKDIYNLNLKSVHSNEDLGALWDYVTRQTANGGCIVMEDIDASTNVVLARNEFTINEDFTSTQPLTPNETPLSLSYLLNILQGSLQRDNSVVVVTTNWINKLDPAFTRDMRFDVKIDMKPADHHQIQEIFQVYFKNRKCPIDLIKTIPEHKYTPARFISEFRQYIKNSDATEQEIFSAFLPSN